MLSYSFTIVTPSPPCSNGDGFDIFDDGVGLEVVAQGFTERANVTMDYAEEGHPGKGGFVQAAVHLLDGGFGPPATEVIFEGRSWGRSWNRDRPARGG